jgi:hypothetical protein
MGTLEVSTYLSLIFKVLKFISWENWKLVIVSDFQSCSVHLMGTLEVSTYLSLIFKVLKFISWEYWNLVLVSDFQSCSVHLMGTLEVSTSLSFSKLFSSSHGNTVPCMPPLFKNVVYALGCLFYACPLTWNRRQLSMYLNYFTGFLFVPIVSYSISLWLSYVLH